MKLARLFLLFLCLALISSTAASAAALQEPVPPSEPIPAAPAVDLSAERRLIEEANSAMKISDYATARIKAAEAVTALLARPEAEQDAVWLELLNSGGICALKAQDPGIAKSAWQRVLEVRARTLPSEHRDLLTVSGNLASAIKTLGDLKGASKLEEKVLEVYSRTLPEEDSNLQAMRLNHAGTIAELGDLNGARVLFEQVFKVFSRTLPDTHPNLQVVRVNLALTLQALGDLQGARALQEKVLDVRTSTLSDEHPSLQAIRAGLGATLLRLGDSEGARKLFEKVLEVTLRTLPSEHLDVQRARLNLAASLHDFGDLQRCRVLEEKVLEMFLRALPDEHPDLQRARMNLAATLRELGDRQSARTLGEKVLEVYSRVLPEDHPDLQRARMNLAATLRELGDRQGARTLGEKVLEVWSRTLHEGHLDLEMARMNLAITIYELGEFEAARQVFQKMLDVLSERLSEDNLLLQKARQSLAKTLRDLGDLHGARLLDEKVLDVRERTLPSDDLDLQDARQNLAVTIARQEACKSEQRGRARDRCIELIAAMCRGQVAAAHAAILTSSSREAEDRCVRLAENLNGAISFAVGYGVFDPMKELGLESLVLAQATRGGALASAELIRRARGASMYGILREKLKKASGDLASLIQRGSTSEEYDRIRSQREVAERELIARARELAGGRLGALDFTVQSLAVQIPEHVAAVSYRRYRKSQLVVDQNSDSTNQAAVSLKSTDSLCAFIVTHADAKASSRGARSMPTLVDLGPIEPIEHAVLEWRKALGASSGRGIGSVAASVQADPRVSGNMLRHLVFDPLIPSLIGAEQVILEFDDVLHLVAFDALPADEKGEERLGDRFRIQIRSTLWEMLEPKPKFEGAGGFLGIGGLNYDGSKKEATAAVAGILRGGAWSGGFSPLPATKREIQGIAGFFKMAFGGAAERNMLDGADATKEKLFELAPKARFIHLATHGWFAPESIKSWTDIEPLDKYTGLAFRQSGEEQIRGMSPMLLCGLALAGANQPENALGRVPGLLTAEEISTLDLTHCELAVLSACDTNVGLRRAGQGVASLQKALQMAGARSVITSLWKVPDEATKDLMLDFYRRLWVEKKPKWQALWEAKMKLCAAKDASGKSRYSTRDWAAWVLTGEPD